MYVQFVHHAKDFVHSEKAKNERPAYVGSLLELLCMKKLANRHNTQQHCHLKGTLWRQMGFWPFRSLLVLIEHI